MDNLRDRLREYGVESQDTEYRYIVQISAFESFRNIARREGIVIPESSTYASFTTPKRLDMRGYKQRGLIWSYSVIKVRRHEEIIEEG
jgi:hypothetical protein